MIQHWCCNEGKKGRPCQRCNRNIHPLSIPSTPQSALVMQCMKKERDVLAEGATKIYTLLQLNNIEVAY